jgi:hypothetical protein
MGAPGLEFETWESYEPPLAPRMDGGCLLSAPIPFQLSAARDFPGLLARVRAGTEVVIEDPASPAVVLRTPVPPLRRLSESLRLSKEHGSTATLDGGFADDLDAVVNSHPETLENPWA